MNYTLSFCKFKILIIFSLFACWCAFSYGQSSVEVIKVDTLPAPQAPALQTLPKFRIGAQIGYAYRFGHIPNNIHPNLRNHLNQLKSNFGYGADMTYYFKKNIGLGVKYTGISTKAETSNFPVENGGAIIGYVPVSQKVDIHYIGGTFAARRFIKVNKQCFFANISLGCLMYRDNVTVFGERVKTTGNTFGFMVEVGYDFFASKYLAIGLQLSTALGMLNTVSYTHGNVTIKETLPQRENLSYINIALGFRFYK